MHGYMGLGGAGWGMGGFWLLVLVGVVVAVAAGVAAARQRGGARSSDTPEQILKRRYASGEIDSEEFEERLERLRR